MSRLYQRTFICLVGIGIFFSVPSEFREVGRFSSPLGPLSSSWSLHNMTQTLVAIEVEKEHQQHLRHEGNTTTMGSKNTFGKDNDPTVEMTRRICTEEFIPFLGGTTVDFRLWYQCAGDRYDDFAQAMLSLAAHLPATFGRRTFPMAANTSVLVLGNSHTRQMLQALICQFREEVVEYVAPLYMQSFVPEDSMTVRFRNNSTMTSLTNNAVVYSPQWPLLVEGIIGRPVSSFDGIVLGQFNGFKDSNGTTFMQLVTETLKNLSEPVDFARSTPPTLRHVVAEFNGPVVYVGSFSIGGEVQLRSSLKIMTEANATSMRNNISVIDGRKYVKILQLECASNGRNETGTCDEGDDSHKAHRCVGSKGGHPDLIVWELAEILNNL